MSTQKERIVAFLEARGELGVLNTELMPIAWRYSARIDNLRKDGYRIRASHIDKSIWRFTLLPQDPQQPQALQVAAELDEPKYLDFNEQLRTYVSGTAPGFVDSLT